MATAHYFFLIQIPGEIWIAKENKKTKSIEWLVIQMDEWVDSESWKILSLFDIGVGKNDTGSRCIGSGQWRAQSCVCVREF
jgi:hypothetical protein